MKVEALFVSDVHLGSRGCNSDEFHTMLKEYKPGHLFIVGDFIDGWLLKRRNYWTQEYIIIIRKLLSYSKKGTKITYITGNHDDFLRAYTPFELGDNIEVVDEYIWNDYYISHGDLYDGVVKLKWLGVLGSYGYELAINVDRLLKFFGYNIRFSKMVKKKVKRAVKFITDFERQMCYQAFRRNCKGVICGHIHTPSDKTVRIKEQDIRYLNCGDWIENNSYFIFNDNKFELKHF